MPLNSLSDQNLWALIVSGNYRAFTVLYQRHWFKLFKTAQKYLKDNEACEEAVHDLFLNLWKRRDHLHINNFDHYLKAAMRYQVYAAIKKATKAHIIYGTEVFDEALPPQFNLGYENILYSELELKLAEQLNSLPVRCREIFLLSRKEQLSNIEIAEKLGISKRSVENQITIALKHLRFSLNDLVVSALLFLFFC